MALPERAACSQLMRDFYEESQAGQRAIFQEMTGTNFASLLPESMGVRAFTKMSTCSPST